MAVMTTTLREGLFLVKVALCAFLCLIRFVLQ